MTDVPAVVMIEVKHIGLERMKRPLYITYLAERHEQMNAMLLKAGFEIVKEDVNGRS